MHKPARFREVVRFVTIAAALGALVAGCKPDSEPEHPYGKVPAAPKPAVEAPAEVPAEPVVAPAEEAAAKPSADVAPEEAAAADAGAAPSEPTVVGPEGSGATALPTPEGAADVSTRFYSLVGLRLVGRTDAGTQRWLFKQNGFFDRELHAPDRSVTVWNGTWKLESGTLALTYKEAVRTGAEGEGAAATATDGTASLPVLPVGKLKLAIGGVEVAVDLDD